MVSSILHKAFHRCNALIEIVKLYEILWVGIKLCGFQIYVLSVMFDTTTLQINFDWITNTLLLTLSSYCLT